MGSSGLEPPTSRLSGVRSNHLSYEPINDPLVCRFSLVPSSLLFPKSGGDERDRTDDPLLAKQVLSQLSYTPKYLLKVIRPSKLNNDLIKSPELTLDVKSVMFQTD